MTPSHNPIATVALMRHGGSHLIRPTVAELGFDIIEPGNFGAPFNEAQGPTIVWLRDPRDRMVSSLRWWRGKPRKGAHLPLGGDDAQLAWMLGAGGFLSEMLRWANIWCDWPGALRCRFEDYRRAPCAEIARIATFLRTPTDPVLLRDKVFEKGRTFTGRYSDWRESFGPLSHAAWAAGDGDRLLALMRYQ